MQKVETLHLSVVECPCCGTPLDMPSLNAIVVARQVSPLQRSILETVWKGKGHAVPAFRIFDAMYADDADGGPSNTQMHKAMREALFRLRQKLAGTGIEIAYDRFRRGYRLVLQAEQRLRDKQAA